MSRIHFNFRIHGGDTMYQGDYNCSDGTFHIKQRFSIRIVGDENDSLTALLEHWSKISKALFIDHDDTIWAMCHKKKNRKDGMLVLNGYFQSCNVTSRRLQYVRAHWLDDGVKYDNIFSLDTETGEVEDVDDPRNANINS